MATVEVTEANFTDTINSGTVVLDFWAEWCGPCKRFAPIFEKVSDEMTDVTFGKVDTEANQNLAGAMGIQAIPTLAIFRDGVMVFRESGLMPADALTEVLEKAKALDMDEVRKQIQEQQGQ